MPVIRSRSRWPKREKRSLGISIYPCRLPCWQMKIRTNKEGSQLVVLRMSKEYISNYPLQLPHTSPVGKGSRRWQSLCFHRPGFIFPIYWGAEGCLHCFLFTSQWRCSPNMRLGRYSPSMRKGRCSPTMRQELWGLWSIGSHPQQLPRGTVSLSTACQNLGFKIAPLGNCQGSARGSQGGTAAIDLR